MRPALKAWFDLFQWATSSLLAVHNRDSMSLRTWAEAARAAWLSSLFFKLNLRHDSGSDPLASTFSTPGCSEMFLELFRSWKHILSISRARSFGMNQ